MIAIIGTAMVAAPQTTIRALNELVNEDGLSVVEAAERFGLELIDECFDNSLYADEFGEFINATPEGFDDDFSCWAELDPDMVVHFA